MNYEIETIKVVGRYRLTPLFAERAFKRYARRIVQKAMPTEAVQGELCSPEWFSAPVNAKAKHLVTEIGGLDDDSETPQRSTHAAMQIAANHYGYGQLPVPVFPDDEPPPPEQDGEGEEGGKPSKEKRKDDKSKSETKDKKKEGSGLDGENKADTGETPADDEGKGDESNSDDGNEGDGADGDGESEGEGKEDDSPSDGGGDAGDGDAAGEDGKGEDNNESEASDGESEDGESARHVNGGRSGSGAVKKSPEREDKPLPLLHLNLHEQRMEFADVEEPEMPEIIPTPLRRYGYFDDEAEVQIAQANQVMARVRNELMAYSRHRHCRDRDVGDVDFTKLVDLAQGTNLDRVFYTMTHAKRLNCCVQLLIDASGSMGRGSNSKMGISAQLAYMICSVLEKLHVPCQVLVENGNATLVKDWHERLDQAQVHQILASGGNCVPHSMTQACRVLAKRREQKHIQIITTDGDIGWSTAKTREFYRGMSREAQAGETPADWQARVAAMDGQRSIQHEGGYTGDAGPGVKITTGQLEARLHQLYKDDPKLRTYGFGIEIDVPPGLFHRTFNRLRTDNMVEVIIETLGRVLTHDRE